MYSECCAFVNPEQAICRKYYNPNTSSDSCNKGGHSSFGPKMKRILRSIDVIEDRVCIHPLDSVVNLGCAVRRLWMWFVWIHRLFLLFRSRSRSSALQDIESVCSYRRRTCEYDQHIGIWKPSVWRHLQRMGSKVVSFIVEVVHFSIRWWFASTINDGEIALEWHCWSRILSFTILGIAWRDWNVSYGLIAMRRNDVYQLNLSDRDTVKCKHLQFRAILPNCSIIGNRHDLSMQHYEMMFLEERDVILAYDLVKTTRQSQDKSPKWEYSQIPSSSLYSPFRCP